MIPLLLSSLLACERPPLAPSARVRPLEIVVPELDDDLEVQAMSALASDARRREARFRDAAEPGYLFESTRVPQAELEAGLWSARDIFQLGGQLFQYRFTDREGLGGADAPAFRRFQQGERGGPEAGACADCHWRGGPAGGGDGADNAYLGGDGEHQSTALPRNPRALVGLGVLLRLAEEMTAELQATRDGLVKAARAQGQPLRVDLEAKGVHFGWLGAGADGALDPRGLEGIDADLVVRPLGWKGEHNDLRAVVEDELRAHLGMQSSYVAARLPPAQVGPHGAPDPDGDGVTDEISEGQVSALSLYLAMQELPIVHLPERADQLEMWTRGQALFSQLGCAGCHQPVLTLKDPRFRLESRDGGEALTVNLLQDGGAPRPEASEDGSTAIYLFSDLKRHAMGEELAEARALGAVAADVFLTPPLWGLSRTRPYLHDGRAPTLDAAILAHGGEAQGSRDAYAALGRRGQYPLRLYLTSLNRAPRLVVP